MNLSHGLPKREPRRHVEWILLSKTISVPLDKRLFSGFVIGKASLHLALLKNHIMGFSSGIASHRHSYYTFALSRGPIAPFPPSQCPSGLVSSVAALLFLDPYPLLLATYADGAIRVWGVKGSPLKGLLVLTFPNQAPKEAYFWGDEDAEYPLLRYTAMSTLYNTYRKLVFILDRVGLFIRSQILLPPPASCKQGVTCGWAVVS